jgi:glycerol uptake facilitator-like aquaporin
MKQLTAVEIPGNQVVTTLAAPLALFYGVGSIGPISGGAFNPALGIMANAVASMEQEDGGPMEIIYVYIVGPLIGAVVGSLMFIIAKNSIVQMHGSAMEMSAIEKQKTIAARQEG